MARSLRAGDLGRGFHPDRSDFAYLIIRKGFGPRWIPTLPSSKTTARPEPDGYLRARCAALLSADRDRFLGLWWRAGRGRPRLRAVLLRNLSKEIDLEGSLAAQMAAMDAAGGYRPRAAAA